MKKFLLSGSIVALLLPGLAWAAFDTVSLTTDAKISAGGVTLDVSGATAVVESITVQSGTFSFVLLSGSSLQVTSATGQYISTDADGSYITTDTCSGGTSVLKFSSSSATVTINVTPSSSTACSGHATGAAAAAVAATTGGGGGPPVASGGGGGAFAAPTITVTTPAATPASSQTSSKPTVAGLQAQLNALLAQIAGLTGKATPSANAYINANANASFKRTLSVGSTGADVKALQVYLNTHGFMVTKSGAGSSGKETTRFGGATKAALKAWQKSVGITPANGLFGPKTRAYIAAHP